MDEIDHLLSELKAEYNQPEPKKSSPNKTPPPQKPLNPKSSSSLEQLLGEVKKDLAQGKPSQSSYLLSSSIEHNCVTQSNSTQKNKLLQELYLEDLKDKSSQVSPSSIQQPKPSQSNPSQTSHLLQELQTEFKEQEKLEERSSQEKQLEKQHLEEQRRQRKQQALARQAQEWLNKLDLKSEEGRWFEEFSYSYNSKLQAAIDYLEALRETGSLS